MLHVILVASFFIFFTDADAFSKTLPDYIPLADKVYFLKNFVTERVQHTENGVMVKGILNGKQINAIQNDSLKTGTFEIVPGVQTGITLADVIPELHDFPGVNAVAFKRLTFDEATLAVSADIALGKYPLTFICDIHNRSATVQKGTGAHGAATTLGRVIPLFKDVPVVNLVTFEALTFAFTTKTISTTAALNTADVALAIDVSKGVKALTVGITPASPMAIGDVFTDLRDVPAINDFTFVNVTFDAGTGTTSLTGTLNNAEATGAISLARGVAKPVFTFTAKAPIAIGDMLPDLRDAPVVNDFTFTAVGFDTDARLLTLTGSLNRATATGTVDTSKGVAHPAFTLTAPSPIAIDDVFPDLHDTPVVNDFTFTAASFDTSARILALTGSLNKATTTAVVNARKGLKNLVLSLTAQSPIAIGDALPDLHDVPLVNAFTFVKTAFDAGAKTLSLTGKLVNAEATASLDLSKGVKKPAFDLAAQSPIAIGDAFPALRDAPVVNDFTFVALHYETDTKQLAATGMLNNAEATCGIDVSKSVTHPVLTITATKAPITIGGIIPAIAAIPGINALGVESVTVQDTSITADVSLNKAHATLAWQFPNLKAALKNMVLTLTPTDDQLGLGTLFPELKGVPGFSDFKLSLLRFDDEAKSLVATLSFNKLTAISLSLNREKSDKKTGNVFTLSGKGLSLGNIVASLKDIPVLSDVQFDAMDIGMGFIGATVEVAGYPVSLMENLAKGFAALDFGPFDPSMIIPSLAGTVISDLKLASTLFVIKKSDSQLGKEDFPPDWWGGLGNIDFSKPFTTGINLLASIDRNDLGTLKSAFDSLGMVKDAFPLRGVCPREIFKYVAHASRKNKDRHPKDVDENSILKGISLGITVPVPSIPGVDKFLTFDSATVGISGDLGDTSLWGALPEGLKQFKPRGAVDISLQGGVKVAIGSFKENMRALVDLNGGDKGGALSLLAVTQGAVDKPFGISGLTLTAGGFVASLAHAASTSATLSLFGTAKVHDKDKLAVSAVFMETGGLPTLQYFEIAGPLTLADLKSGIPNGDGCILNDLKLYPTGIEAVAEFRAKGLDSKYNAYLFEMDSPTGTATVAALDLTFDLTANGTRNFSLGNFARMAGLKQAKAATIQTHLDAMAVANGALILSSKAIPLVSPASLRAGIAKDLFGKIFGKSTIPIKINNVTFLSDFQAELMGDIGKKLVHGVGGVKLGLTEEAIINGDIGGLFDSAPLSLELEFLMAQSCSIDNLQKTGLTLPKFLKAKPSSVGGGEKAGLFLRLLDETVEVGLLAGYDATFGKTAFDFTGTLGVQLAEEEVGLSLSGAMTDNWQNAFGIKGFALENLAVTGEIEEGPPPSLKLGLGGETTILGRDFGVASDVSLGLAGDIPIPDGLGMKTTANELDEEAYKILTYVLLAGQVSGLVTNPELMPVAIPALAIGAVLSIDGLAVYDVVTKKKVTFKSLLEAPGHNVETLVGLEAKVAAWLLGVKNLYLSFATPGMSDTTLGIADGVHCSGNVALFGGLIKSKTIQPKITWIYDIAQAISKAKQKTRKTFLTATSAPNDAAASFSHDYRLLHDIVAKELGLSDKAISVAYPKPSASDLAAYRESLHFTVGESFKLGGLDFVGADVTLVPFKVTSRAKLFGSEEDVVLSIKDGSLTLETKTKLAGICETSLTMEYDPDADDFTIIADLKENAALQKWLDNEIAEGAKQISTMATDKLKALDHDLDVATKARDAAAKDLDRAQKAAAAISKDSVARLEQTTNNFKQAYDYAQSQYNGCSGWKKYYCRSKWWPRKGLAWDAWQSSQELLTDAQKALAEEKALAVDIHAAQITFTKKANEVALAAKDVAAAGEIADVIGLGLGTFVSSAQQVATRFSVQEVYLVGSLKDLKKGMPLVMEIYFTIDGKKYKEFFAVDPAKEAFNALSFGLLPIIVCEHVVQDLEKTLDKELSATLKTPATNVASRLSTWIQAHIYELMGGLRDNLEKQIVNIEYALTQEESKFKKVMDSLEAHSGKFLSGYTDLTDQANQIVSTYKMTDFMPVSSHFVNSYLAVGHSSLCLGVAANGVDVYQQNCKDENAEQWTTGVIKDDGGNDSGYVQMKSKGLCLKAKSSDNKSGQLLSLAQCSGKDDHEKWKVVSQDGFYDKIINRFSQKCLHFDTENANDKTGYAVWTSCFGADSQGFRAIEDAEKPEFHTVNEMIRAGNGMCLATDRAFEHYFSRTAKGHSTSTREDFKRMQAQRHNVLHAAACDGSARDRFNYVEKVNGDLKLVHADSGWCVVADAAHNGVLILKPCNDGKDMFWRTKDGDGNAFELLNMQSNRCMNLPSATIRTGPNNSPGAAQLSQCQGVSSQLIDFVHK